MFLHVTGVVSFSRLAQLDDMSIDLTEQLLRKNRENAASSSSSSSASSSMTDAQGRAASTARPLRKQKPQNPLALPPSRPARQRAAAAASPSYEYKDLPTRGETKRFNRATKSAIRTAPTTTLGAVGTLPPEEAAKRRRIKVGRLWAVLL